ncbi:MAG: DUF2851 family protein [Puniceicoccaceae bacterium]|nr:MAG: DUF2851 family protein [Puniceicoccaceae bacterium]
MQGLYGPFSLSERVLQKIWLKGDFDQSQLRTQSGQIVQIIDPGRWNLLEGPDFIDARLRLDGRECVGDVEVHFDASDWNFHGHQSNPNFARVCLHVVLLPDAAQKSVETSQGSKPETIYLMPLLDRDLEDYAVDDALLQLEQVEDTAWMLEFMNLPLDTRQAKLRAGAESRWSRKQAFCGKRLAGAGWRRACHQYCLEVLGYARNRAPMARLALTYGIEDFASGQLSTDRLFEEVRSHWRLSGLRPANHPKHRLGQYLSICAAHPDWPERLMAVFQSFPVVDGSMRGAAFRRAVALPQLQGRISSEVFADTISAKRLNTMICDAFLPLAQAQGVLPAEAYWMHWPGGDAPDALHRFLKQGQIIDRSEPFSNGQFQGALHCLIQQSSGER